MQSPAPDAHEEKVVVVIPALNEADTIGGVVRQCREALRDSPHQILVVDGRSSDSTAMVSKREGAQVITQKGSGYGDALISGFGYALRVLKPDIIVMIDADGTYSPQDLGNLLKPITSDVADLVIGNRFANLKKGAMPFVNRVGNMFLSGLSKYLFKTPVLDTQSGFRAFKARMLGSLVFKNPGMPLASEMIVEAQNANYRILQVPISYELRKGKSKLRPMRDGMLILGTLIRLYRDYSPLFFFGAIGSFFLAAGGILALYMLVTYLLAQTPSSFVTVTTTAVMFVSGLIIIVMGLLADMIKDMRERFRVFESHLAEILLQNGNTKTKETNKKKKE